MHCGPPRRQMGQLDLAAVGAGSGEEIPRLAAAGRVAVRAIQEPGTVGGGPRMGVERAGARRRQPRGRLPFLEPHVEQLDGGGSAIDPRDPRREDHLPAVVRPDRHIARAAMKIGNIEKLHHATIAVAVADLPQPRAVGPDDVRMAVVMLPRHKQQPLAVGGPGRRKDERVAGIDLLALATVGIGEPHLVVLVVGDPPAVG